MEKKWRSEKIGVKKFFFKNASLNSDAAPDCHEKHKKDINHFDQTASVRGGRNNINIVEKTNINIFIYFGSVENDI